MTTQTGDNTHVVAIEGNFDDAQTNVKSMFNDAVLRERLAAHKLQFSSANSMNIGRLVPQIVYYVYAYAQLVKTGQIQAGEAVNFAVPTGNFGNILAAYYAKQIGLPVGKLICASNENNVLTDFFKTQVYDKKRSFKVTSSPSMDILVSSNLERLIFHLLGNSAEKTADLMKSLNQHGQYELTDFDPAILRQNMPPKLRQQLKSNEFMRRLITLKIRTQRSLQLFIKNTGQLQVMRLRLLLLQPPVLTNSQLWQSKL